MSFPASLLYLCSSLHSYHMGVLSVPKCARPGLASGCLGPWIILPSDLFIVNSLLSESHPRGVRC